MECVVRTGSGNNLNGADSENAVVDADIENVGTMDATSGNDAQHIAKCSTERNVFDFSDSLNKI